MTTKNSRRTLVYKFHNCLLFLWNKYTSFALRQKKNKLKHEQKYKKTPKNQIKKKKYDKISLINNINLRRATIKIINFENKKKDT